MSTVFDLEEKNPFDCIKGARNTRFVKHLKANGIDGFKINKLLFESHGLKIELPIMVSKEEAEARKQTDYARRSLHSLIKSPIVIDDDKKILTEMYNNYYDARRVVWKKGKTAQCVYMLKAGDDSGKAKTVKQMLGQRVVKIYDYILPFICNNSKEQKTYKQTDVFGLIAELFFIIGLGKYTATQIKYLYFNNK